MLGHCGQQRPRDRSLLLAQRPGRPLEDRRDLLVTRFSGMVAMSKVGNRCTVFMPALDSWWRARLVGTAAEAM